MSTFFQNGSPVARWLDTFVCKQYADIFKKFGYDTLNDVCRLEEHQLIKMGVAQLDIEKIIENVSVLRQTLQAGSSNNGFKSNYLAHGQLLDSSVNSENNNCKIESNASIISVVNKPNRRTKATKADKQKQQVPNVIVNQVVPVNLSLNTNEVQTKPTTNRRTKKNAKANTNLAEDINNINININNNIIDYNNNSYTFNNNLAHGALSNNNNNNNMKPNMDNSLNLNNNQLPISNSTSKYTCLPVNNSANYSNTNDYYQQQQHQQQPQHLNFRQQNQQLQQPSVLLSPISNPPSLSSTSSYNTANFMNNQIVQSHPYGNNNNNQNNFSNWNSNPSNGYSNNNANLQHQSSYNQQQIYQNSTSNFNSNNDMSNQNVSILGKSTPLDYLERLALLPECQVVDPKSIVNDETNILNGEINQNQQFIMNNNNTNFQQQQIESLKRVNLNELNSDTAATSAKKMCTQNNNASSSNSNSPTMKSTNSKKMVQQQQQQQPQIILNDSPSSSCSSTSLSSTSTSSFGILPSSINSNSEIISSNNNMNGNNITSIIDASNFDFLDYLPELNSNTIDQTINSNAIKSSSMNSSNFNSKFLDNNSNTSPDSLDSIYIDLNNKFINEHHQPSMLVTTDILNNQPVMQHQSQSQLINSNSHHQQKYQQQYYTNNSQQY